MADGELSTAEKTRLDRRKQQSEMELSMLQSMMESASMQNYSIPDLDESIRPVFSDIYSIKFIVNFNLAKKIYFENIKK